MFRFTWLPLVAVASALVPACSDSTPVDIDASADAGSETIVDAAVDAAIDARVDVTSGDGQPDGMQSASRRILFVIDTSQTMSITDPVDPAADPTRATNRSRAITELIDQYIDLDPAHGSAPAGDAAFAIISFNTSKEVLTTVDGGTPGFTSDPAVIRRALAGVNVSEGLTDYEGALLMATNLLSTDIAAQIKGGTSAVERMRYAVVFLSDGSPAPQINDVEDWDNVVPGLVEELIGAQDPSTLPQYNTRSRVMQQIKELVALRSRHSPEQFLVHTAYVQQAGSGNDAGQLLRDMAKEADGIYRRFDDPETLELSVFRY